MALGLYARGVAALAATVLLCLALQQGGQGGATVLYTSPHSEVAPFARVWNPDTNNASPNEEEVAMQTALDKEEENTGLPDVADADGEIPAFSGEDYFTSKPLDCCNTKEQQAVWQKWNALRLKVEGLEGTVRALQSSQDPKQIETNIDSHMIGPTGHRGPHGPAGPVGPPGLPGAQGPQGPAGPAGESGPEGDVGAAGVKGQSRVVGTPSWALSTSQTQSTKSLKTPMLRGLARPGQRKEGKQQERQNAVEQIRMQERQEAAGFAEERQMLRRLAPRGKGEFVAEPAVVLGEPQY